jgi:RHS repeat-associated protein
MGTWNFSYDAVDRLSAPPSYTATCAPPMGSGFTLTARYLVDLGGDQVTEINGAGLWQHSNVFSASRLTATYDAKGLHYELADPLGTKRVQANVYGQTEVTWASQPYGDALTPTYSSLTTADDATEHHFTGKERDSESGNDYFMARYYSSAMGRFMSPDWSAKVMPVPYAKLGNPQSLNLYAYVGNNPLRFTDPTGHDLQEVCKDKSSTCGKSHWWNSERHVGTTDANGHFHVTHFQTDSSGNLAGHDVSFNSGGIHIDGNKGEFIAGTDPTRVNGESGTAWAGTHFVANSNCGGTCEAGGALFGNFDLKSGLGPDANLSILANQNLVGPNKGLDAFGDHPGAQFRGGNLEGPDMHLSLVPGSWADPMHFDNRYPYGSASGWLDHAAGWLNPAGHAETPLPEDIHP